MAAKKKLSTGKKVAIGLGITGVVAAILCYFYCPCFNKDGVTTSSTGAGGGVGPASYPGSGATPTTSLLSSFASTGGRSAQTADYPYTRVF